MPTVKGLAPGWRELCPYACTCSRHVPTPGQRSGVGRNRLRGAAGSVLRACGCAPVHAPLRADVWRLPWSVRGPDRSHRLSGWGKPPPHSPRAAVRPGSGDAPGPAAPPPPPEAGPAVPVRRGTRGRPSPLVPLPSPSAPDLPVRPVSGREAVVPPRNVPGRGRLPCAWSDLLHSCPLRPPFAALARRTERGAPARRGRLAPEPGARASPALRALAPPRTPPPYAACAASPAGPRTARAGNSYGRRSPAPGQRSRRRPAGAGDGDGAGRAGPLGQSDIWPNGIGQ